MLKVCKSQCDKCLFSKNKIVSEARKKDIIKGCLSRQTHFICHKSKETVCAGFYKSYGQYSQMIRIAGRLNAIQFVEVT